MVIKFYNRLELLLGEFMEYVKGKPYFSDVEDKIKSYPYLDENISCDCLVVGGGIDGAITAYYLAENNIDTILIDKYRLGFMNTSCATALLEYQLDDHANDLTKFFTKEELVDVYRIGLKALADIEDIIKKLGNFCNYQKCDALVFSLKSSEAKQLKREYIFRKENGFDVAYFDKMNNPYPFALESAILSKGGGAHFNPYLFEKELIENIDKKIKIYENTEAVSIKKCKNKFIITTQYGIEIMCNNIVCTTGYNTNNFSKDKLCDKYVSYTIVSKPLKEKLWKDGALLQDNSNPYHYLRLSYDNRLIIGGEDVLFKGKVIKDKVASKKYKMLREFAIELFPNLKDIDFEYEFCGIFATTSNNLSIIGEDSKVENLYYNLGYGANGIIYSIYGAQNLVRLIKKQKTSKSLPLFSMTRKLP